MPGLSHSLPPWAPSAACLSWSQIKAHSQDICVSMCVFVFLSARAHGVVFAYRGVTLSEEY